MSPQLAKMLIASVELKCSDEILTIVAMLSVPNVFYRPRDKQSQADAQKATFHQPSQRATTDAPRRLRRLESDRLLRRVVRAALRPRRPHAQRARRARAAPRDHTPAQARRRHCVGVGARARALRPRAAAICAGFFRHGDPRGRCYRTLAEDAPVYIHPSSVLFSYPPEWCIYHELVLTTREYCYNVLAIEPQWLVEVAPQFFEATNA